MQEKKYKKMIAPIIITIILLIYYAIYFFAIAYAVDGILRLALGIIPVLLGIVSVYVCIQRIEEIKGGEEDDLSKY